MQTRPVSWVLSGYVWTTLVLSKPSTNSASNAARLTAGENKALLDPFLPENEKAKAHMQTMLDEIHQQFIDSVKKGRGDRLDTTVEGIFSGLIWTGEAAVNIGLVDELGSSSHVAREVIGEETIVNYTVKQDIFERFAERLGSSVAQVISTQCSTPSLR